MVVGITEISAIVASAGVMVAAIYYIISLRYNMKTREMEMCRLMSTDFTSDQGMQRYAIMMTMEWKDYDDFNEKYWYSHPEMVGKWTSQFFTWEAMGILLKRRIVGAETMYAMGGYGAIWAWKKYKDIIQQGRSESGVDYYINAEFFAQEMSKVKARRTNEVKRRDQKGAGNG